MLSAIQKKQRFTYGIALLILVSVYLFIWVAKPALNSVKQKTWVSQNCTITNSRLEKEIDSNRYRIIITATYYINKRKYLSGLYRPDTGTTYKIRAADSLLTKYPKGMTTTCWVNPESPFEAYINTDIPTYVWKDLLKALPFLLIGLFLLSSALLQKPPVLSKEKITSKDHEPKPEPKIPDSNDSITAQKFIYEADEKEKNEQPVDIPTTYTAYEELPPRASSKALFWFGLILGVPSVLAFGGIIYVFLISIAHAFIHLDLESAFIAIVVIPLIAATFFFSKMSLSFILRSFSPEPILSLSNNFPSLGETVELDWHFTRKPKGLEYLEISLKGKERVAYESKGSGETENIENEFFHQEIYSSSEYSLKSTGKIEITPPDYLMHSFDSGNNKIEWYLRLDAKYTKWPDTEKEYPIEVQPLDVSEEES